MPRFEFATASRVIFGAGTRAEVAPAAATFGRRALLVTGRAPSRGDAMAALLDRQGLDVARYVIDREPDLDVVRRGAALARDGSSEVVIALGGGSVMDGGKAIAALATQPSDVVEYLEVVGAARALDAPALPVIAVPTTAGTGAEVTRNAVLDVRERRVKVSLRHPSLLPRVAVVDPELTRDLPAALTTTTGLDALTQLIEAYVSIRATPMTDALCVAGIPLTAAALPRAIGDGHDPQARADMSLAALWSGMALANAGLGAVHGLAGPIGGLCHAAHGAICALLLPWVIAANAKALDARSPSSRSRARLDHVATMLTGSAAAGADDATAWLLRLIAQVRVPPLRVHGVTSEDVPAIVAQAQQANSMKGNPVPLTPAELSSIVAAAL